MTTHSNKPYGERSRAGYSPCGRKRDGHDLAIKQRQVLITKGKKADAYDDFDLLLF